MKKKKRKRKECIYIQHPILIPLTLPPAGLVPRRPFASVPHLARSQELLVPVLLLALEAPGRLHRLFFLPLLLDRNFDLYFFLYLFGSRVGLGIGIGIFAFVLAAGGCSVGVVD